MIELKKVIYDKRARDGTWCKLPYPNHKYGCPNFPICPKFHEDFTELQKRYERWGAVFIEFDLKRHSEMMKEKHPEWSYRKLRNLLYWQKRLRNKLFLEACIAREGEGEILEIPEAYGVDVFNTMELVGIHLERNPDIVRKVMLIGFNKERSFD